MNIDEIINGLRKAVEEMEEERKRMIILEETVINLITEADIWFAKHGHELPEKGE